MWVWQCRCPASTFLTWNLVLKGSPSPVLLITLLMGCWRAESPDSSGSAEAAEAGYWAGKQDGSKPSGFWSLPVRQFSLELCPGFLQDVIRIMNFLSEMFCFQYRHVILWEILKYSIFSDGENWKLHPWNVNLLHSLLWIRRIFLLINAKMANLRYKWFLWCLVLWMASVSQ